jgi:PAS domain S-box-containing protein
VPINKAGALRIALGYAAAAMAWIAVSDLVLVLLAPRTATLAWLEMAKGASFVVVTAALLYGFLARRAPDKPSAPEAPGAHEPAGIRFPLLLVAAGAAAAIVLFLSIDRSERRVEEQVGRQLETLADSKSTRIELYLVGRLRIAGALAASGDSNVVLLKSLAQPAEEGALPWPWLDRTSAEAGFAGAAVLLPDRESALVRTGLFPRKSANAALACRLSLERGRPAHSDLSREAGGEFLYFAAALSSSSGRPLAACLVFRSDPRQQLYPILADAAIDSRTGETVLARADGESIAFFGPLRHRQQGDGPLLVPARGDLPAAMGVRGHVGPVRGNDYRGVLVEAVVRPVPGTAWQVVAKIDRAEVDSLAGATTRLATRGAILVIVTTLVGGLLAWRSYASAAAARERAALDERDRAARRERDWAGLFFSMPFIGMAVTSAATRRWVRFNDRLCDMLGYGRDELEQLTWTELTHPDDLDRDLGEFNRVMAGESDGYRIDKRYRHKDGHLVHATIDVRAIREADGHIEHFVATVEDTTERVRQIESLARLRDLYNLLAQANETILRCNRREEIFDRVVRAAVECTGLRFAWIGVFDEQGILDPVARHGEDRGYVDEARRHALEVAPPRGGPSDEAVRAGRHVVANDFLADPDLSAWHAAASRAGIGASAAFPLHEAGRVTGALKLYATQPGYFDEDVVRTLDEMALDISFALDHIATRADLEAAQRLVQDVVDASEAVVYVFDREGRCVLGNRTFSTMLGRALDQCLGLPREALMTADAARIHRENDLRVLATGLPMRFTEILADGDARRIFESSKFPVRDASGAICGVGGISTEVTELVRASERLADDKRELERRVAERTHELTVARDQALAADRVKTLFLATVSHELRSPLHSIIGFTGLMLDRVPGPLNEEQARQLAIVDGSSRHLLQLINDVLDLSRIEAGELSVTAEPLDLSATIRTSAETATVLAKSRGLALDVALPSGETRVRADPRRVKQVLDNLLSNAVKFTDRGGIRVTVARQDGDFRIAVSDTGIGIPEEAREALFRPFARHRPDPGREGTGLGLAIAQRLVKAMGGEIGYESRPGAGSTFWFTLPPADAPPDAA